MSWKHLINMQLFEKFTLSKNWKLLTDPFPATWLLVQIDWPGHWPSGPQEPICTPTWQVHRVFASYPGTTGIGGTKYPVEICGSWVIDGYVAIILGLWVTDGIFSGCTP